MYTAPIILQLAAPRILLQASLLAAPRILLPASHWQHHIFCSQHPYWQHHVFCSQHPYWQHHVFCSKHPTGSTMCSAPASYSLNPDFCSQHFTGSTMYSAPSVLLAEPWQHKRLPALSILVAALCLLLPVSYMVLPCLLAPSITYCHSLYSYSQIPTKHHTKPNTALLLLIFYWQHVLLSCYQSHTDSTPPSCSKHPTGSTTAFLHLIFYL
jgi:hypothetical protein